MKIIVQEGNNFVLRFDKGEELFTELIKFMEEKSIGAGVFSGIGACSEAEISCFNTQTKIYDKKLLTEDLEILSINGNGSLKDGKPFIHAHGVFGKADLSALGGHIFKLVVSVTSEIFLTKLDGGMKRELNPDFNLNLLA